MSSVVPITFHSSAFPEQVTRDLIASLRTRQVNHKFHYDSVKQTQKWLALHQAYSPSRTDADCTATYERSFEAVAARIQRRDTHLIGLGCGGGQKDARLLKLLRSAGCAACYTPVDVSSAMVLVARQKAMEAIGAERCSPVVCDLGSTEDWSAVLEPASGRDRRPSGETTRLFTFFGMLPNFESHIALPRLARLVRPQDYLLLSANLSPGSDYASGVQRILPLYDNALTRDWLMTFLVDLGVERGDGDVRFVIEEGPEQNGLKRVAAYYDFAKARAIQAYAERFEFKAGDSIRLFFSYRHTPQLVRELFLPHGLKVLAEWVTQSGEEGVFLVSGAA